MGGAYGGAFALYWPMKLMDLPQFWKKDTFSSPHERRSWGGDSILKVFGKNRLGEVAKEAFSSGVETTFLCEQITNGVTSFGLLLSQRRSQRRPKQKRDPNSTECLHESQK